MQGQAERQQVERPQSHPPRAAEVTNVCPDCGQVLVRPADFSAARLLYLHRKWGACFPLGQAGPVGPAEEPVRPEESDTRSAAG